jgi:hypothetical protein
MHPPKRAGKEQRSHQQTSKSPVTVGFQVWKIG